MQSYISACSNSGALGGSRARGAEDLLGSVGVRVTDDEGARGAGLSTSATIEARGADRGDGVGVVWS